MQFLPITTQLKFGWFASKKVIWHKQEWRNYFLTIFLYQEPEDKHEPEVLATVDAGEDVAVLTLELTVFLHLVLLDWVTTRPTRKHHHHVYNTTR